MQWLLIFAHSRSREKRGRREREKRERRENERGERRENEREEEKKRKDTVRSATQVRSTELNDVPLDLQVVVDESMCRVCCAKPAFLKIRENHVCLFWNAILI